VIVRYDAAAHQASDAGQWGPPGLPFAPQPRSGLPGAPTGELLACVSASPQVVA